MVVTSKRSTTMALMVGLTLVLTLLSGVASGATATDTDTDSVPVAAGDTSPLGVDPDGPSLADRLLGTKARPQGPVIRASAPVSWGYTRSPDHRLKPKCRRYRFYYVVTPPTDEWAAEVFLRGPGGKGLHTVVLDSNAEPDRARAYWPLCRASLRPGRYTISMKITYLDGRDKYEGFVRPTYFRFKRR